MTRASKAALLSGLIFPGAGHLALRHYGRGAALIVLALAALAVLISSLLQRAQGVVERINAGDIPADFAQIVEMATATTTGTHSPAENTAPIVLLICWLAGIIDAYRLGTAAKKS